MKLSLPLKWPLVGFSLVTVLSSSLVAQETRWSGVVNDQWTQAGNWSDGFPGVSTSAIFGVAGGDVSVGADASTSTLLFEAFAKERLFSGSGSLSAAGITQRFGAGTQRFDLPVALSGAGTVRSDSLAGSLIFEKAFNPVNAREVSLRGLGGGAFEGATRITLTSVTGGGRWVFSGENLSVTSGNAVWNGGSTLVFDYSTNQNPKSFVYSANNLHLRGANIEIIGHATDAITVPLSGAAKTIFNIASLADGYGFATHLSATRPGSAPLTVQISATTDSVNPAAVARFSGDATFQVSALTSAGGSAHAVWLLNDQYAERNADTGNLQARTLSTVDPQSGAMPDGTQYYQVTLGTGTTTRSLAVTPKGIRVTTSAAGGIWKVNNNVLQASSVGTSLLFAGEHALTINANTFGHNGGITVREAHYINLSPTDAALTLDGPLGAYMNHRKSGTGKVIFTNSENKATVASVHALHVGEGTAQLAYSEVMGSAPVDNGVYVQSGATVALSDDLSLASGTTLYLHGLGDNNGGALRNESGTNTLNGKVVLGTTASILSHSGQLTLKGAVEALNTTEPSALLLDGAGATRLEGDLAANLLYGVHKRGSGTVTLAATNLSTAETRVEAGRFLLDSGALSGDLRVASGASFGGSGSLAGATVMEEGSTLTLTLGSASDSYLASSSLFTLESDVQLEISLTQSAALNDVFTLLNGSGVDGTFAGVNGNAFLSGNRFELAYGGVTYELTLAYSDSITATITHVDAVPEPGVAALLGLSLLGYGVWKRRQNVAG